VDGNYLMYRSFWGVRGLVTSYGLAVNATFGFLVSFRKLLDDLRPTKICVVFDGKGKTWRHKLVEKAVEDGVTEKTYKDRTKTGLENFYEQLGFTQKFMKALRIRTYQKPATESDDIIGTLVRKYDAKGYRVILFTKDKDFYQLLKYNCALYKPDGVNRKYYDDSDFRKQYVIGPKQWCAACSLTGDGSDTIMGIRGIGEKNAGLLIKEYNTLR
jgi:DNA polymerase-1